MINVSNVLSVIYMILMIAAIVTTKEWGFKILYLVCIMLEVIRLCIVYRKEKVS